MGVAKSDHSLKELNMVEEVEMMEEEALLCHIVKRLSILKTVKIKYKFIRFMG